ncbi:MAG: hypothetical protein LC754_16265 [Acidobacteria bacterium]|nr:hypothetical protein [Acidobacteriota bacterium]
MPPQKSHSPATSGGVKATVAPPRALVPHAAIPEQLFRVSHQPERRQKNYRPARQPAIVRRGLRPAAARVPPHQSQVRHAVYDDVRDGERVIRIERHDAHVPADAGGRNHEVFPRIAHTPHNPEVCGARCIRDERQPVDGPRDLLDERRQRREVAREEPPEFSRQVRVPVEKRVEGRHVNRRRVHPPTDAPALAHPRAVQRHPTVLLPHEMKDREISQRAPEQQLALRIERHAETKRNQRRQRIQPRAAFQLSRVEVDAEGRRIDVRHVHEQHRRNPRPIRRVRIQHPGLRPDPQREQRHDGASEKHVHVHARRKQPPLSRRGARTLAYGCL